MQKKEIRNQYLAQRTSLTAEDLDKINDAIQTTISNLKLKNKKISLFLSIKKFNELDTFKILQHLEQENTIAAPVSNFSTKEMIHHEVTSNSKLQVNRFNIPEPLDGKVIEPNEFDIVFVPLLALDKKGYRVGYGKGFYDRFLGQCSNHCRFIGLHMFENFVEITDLNSDDIPLHACITPTQYIQF